MGVGSTHHRGSLKKDRPNQDPSIRQVPWQRGPMEGNRNRTQGKPSVKSCAFSGRRSGRCGCQVQNEAGPDAPWAPWKLSRAGTNSSPSSSTILAGSQEDKEDRNGPCKEPCSKGPKFPETPSLESLCLKLNSLGSFLRA